MLRNEKKPILKGIFGQFSLLGLVLGRNLSDVGDLFTIEHNNESLRAIHPYPHHIFEPNPLIRSNVNLFKRVGVNSAPVSARRHQLGTSAAARRARKLNF